MTCPNCGSRPEEPEDGDKDEDESRTLYRCVNDKCGLVFIGEKADDEGGED